MLVPLAASRAYRFAAALGLGLGACSRVPSDPALQPGFSAETAPLRARTASPLAAAASAVSGAASAASAVPASVPAPAPLTGGPSAVASKYGLVVAVEERAARAGAVVLEQGGNAVDAAIATLLALTVTHPSAASLGGEGFALVRPRAGPTEALDFIAKSPAGLTRASFNRMILGQARGPAAVGVPGVVAGVGLLHARFGTRPLAELFAPALALARDGYPLGAWQAELIRKNFDDLKDNAASRALFTERGRPRAAARAFKQPDLAWTLERLARVGVDDFYRGAVAERLARSLAPEGPSLADLKEYQALWRAPVSVPYRDFTLETMPPPSAGGVALVGALLMLGSRPKALAGSTADVHALLEAQRRGQAERRHGVLDPDALSQPERDARQARWLDPAFWLRVPIDPGRATPSSAISALASLSVESEHTTHLSVTDRDGMVVSLTTTLCASFGAKVVAAGTGIVLNNAVATFSGSGVNQPAASRRTVSSMAPSLLLSENRVVAVLGTPGGDTIPSTLTQLVRHLVDEGLPLDSAVQAPRWHQAFIPDEARYESNAGNNPELIRGLSGLGHTLRRFSYKMGDANCIVLDRERAYGYADTREPGVAVAATR